MAARKRRAPSPGGVKRRRRWLRGIEAQGRPVIFYLHPWEVDPEQPRMSGPRRSTFRHYLNLGRVEGRLERLLDDFRFAAVRELLPGLERGWERVQRTRTSQPLR